MTRSQSPSSDDKAAPSPIADVFDFARHGKRVEGEAQMAAMPRVAPVLVEPTGAVHWRVRGAVQRDFQGRLGNFIELEVDGEVPVRCVRCLESVAVRLRVRRRFKIVRDEAQAEREDAEIDDYDVLSADGTLELAELIQDEVLLALPFAPAHERCDPPGAAAGDAAAGADGSAGERASDSAGGEPEAGPFAALAALRRSGPRR